MLGSVHVAEDALQEFFFSSRRRHTRYIGDWSSDVCSSDLPYAQPVFVLAACLFLVLDPGHVVYYTIVHVPLLVRSLQSMNFYEGVSLMLALIAATALSSYLRSEERRVGKECRSRWSTDHEI